MSCQLPDSSFFVGVICVIIGVIAYIPGYSRI